MVQSLGDGEKDALNARLTSYFNKMDEEQKQTFIMVSGMVAILAYIDIAGNRQITRSEIVEIINEQAIDNGVLEPVLALCRSYGLPL